MPLAAGTKLGHYEILAPIGAGGMGEVSNCSAERDLYEGGTAASPAYLGCLEAMTRARTKELAVTYAVKLK